MAVSESAVSAVRDSPSVFTERVLTFSPWDFQSDFMDEDGWRVMVCGRQVGKSRTVAALALHKAVTTADADVLIVAPVQRQSSELFTQIKREMERSPIDNWGVVRETQTILEFDNGSRIICLPAAGDGSTIRTYTADMIIADEAAFIPDVVFEDALEPMLATTGGDMVLASTPFGTSGYLYESFHDSDFQRTQVPMAESPLIDEDYIERQRERKTDMSFKQEVLGEFVEAADALIPRTHIRECTIGAVEVQAAPVYLGVDIARFGQDDTVFLSMDAAGNVFELESTSDMPTTDAQGRIQKLHEENDYSKILIDETGLGGGVVDNLQEDMGKVVEGVTFTINTKQDIYGALQSSFEDRALSLPDNRSLQQQVGELEYEFTSSGKMKVSHPDGGHDDYADALALANWARIREDIGGPKRKTRTGPMPRQTTRTRGNASA